MGQKRSVGKVEVKPRLTGKEPYICPKSAPVRKIVTLLMATLVLGSGLAATGCASRTPQQKKTSAFKRKAKFGKLPCPCESH
jgi:hypothetical protein